LLTRLPVLSALSAAVCMQMFWRPYNGVLILAGWPIDARRRPDWHPWL